MAIYFLLINIFSNQLRTQNSVLVDSSAASPQNRVPSASATMLLHCLNLPCPLTCSEAIAWLLPSWDISIAEVPWYLVKQFGQSPVVESAEAFIERSPDALEKIRLSAIIDGAHLMKEESLHGLESRTD
jgi:hypothetical protein